MKEKVLVVEDETIIAFDIKTCLEKSGYTVLGIAAYGEQAIKYVEQLQPDIVLMDVMLKGEMNGIEAAEKIVTNFHIPVVYLTAYSDESTIKKAKITQPFGYIIKPFEETQLTTTIEIALNKHQTELSMREALNQEKQMREIKSRFVSMVSHEFRNPLSTIFASSELLNNSNNQLNESKKEEYIQYIQNAVKHLDQLLNNVLLIGKSELGKIKLNPEPIDLENFCQELVREIQLTAGHKHEIIFKTQDTSTNNCLSVTTKTRQPCLDIKLLRHILTNLLANAIKYSPQGGIIRFDVYCLQTEAVFRIQDQGIGIPEEDQENLFSSFHRASNVGKIPGNGLGLSIVKEYVELHGGEITVASKVGVGTTFIVSLPFSPDS